MYFRHFKIRELFNDCTSNEVCKCVREGHIDHLLTLLSVLDEFREEFGNSIVVTSSFRDFHHNKRVGGVSNSQHMLGQAIDFKSCSAPFETMVLAFKSFLESSALRRFIGQVIIYKQKQFIHVGLRTEIHKQLMFMYSYL